jgi:hypothetical protein
MLTAAYHVRLQIHREWLARTDSQGVWQTEREAGRELCVQDPRVV